MEGETISAFPVEHLPTIGFHQKDIDEVTVDWKSDSKRHRDGCFEYKISINPNAKLTSLESQRTQEIMVEIARRNEEYQRTESSIKFVGLHAHSGVGSPFDGFGYPQEHMEYAYENGCGALALTDHGNMNGVSYQVLHAKKMQEEGKDFKPIFGVEAYFIPDIVEWKTLYEEHKADKRKARQLDREQSGTTVENEGETKSKGRALNRSRHLVLLAMNQEGLNNIFKLVSESYTGNYFYRKPRIDYALLSKYSSGVIGMSACLGGVYAGNYWEFREDGEEAVLEAMRETTRRMVEIFDDRWYGELQWNNIPEQHELNEYIIRIHKEFGIKLVSTADSHYPNPKAWNDRELYKRLGWLGRGKPEWLDMTLPVSVEEIGYELYPKNGEQIWESYSYYSKECGFQYDDDLVLGSIEESHNIAFDRIERFYPDDTVRLPDFVVPSGYSDNNWLKRLSSEGLFNILKNRDLVNNKRVTTEYEQRLEHELKVIADRGFSKYFLTMKAIADRTNEIQLSGTGRGSAAGSLVAYALGITQVDPIKYGLLFSRFLRSDATDYPDIDYDVSDPMVLKEHLIKEWGDNTVVPISNFNTLQLRSLIKDISKFYDVPFMEANGVTNKMLFEATPRAKADHGIRAGVYNPTFEEVIKYSDSLRNFFRKYPRIEKHVMGIVGQVRSVSRHAGGIVVGEELDKYMPLIASKGIRQTPWSEGQNVRHLEPMGFIKFDVLGLSTLRMIDGCIEKILQRHHGVEKPTFAQIKKFYDEKLHPDTINLDDQQVYENIFHKGKFAGVFQFAETGAQNFATKVKPISIIDLAAITSICRPGPLSAGVDKKFIKAKENPTDINYTNSTVRSLTEETHGFLIFQEQIALLAHKLGKNLTLDEGNLLRKVLTKKGTGKGAEVKEKLQQKFTIGCIEKGMSYEQAEDLWQTFEYFSGYGFNKSHAVSYSLISYQCAWLYNYFPSEWMASFLDKEPESRKEKAIMIAKSHGFVIKPLNVNTSGMAWDILDNKELVAPLTTIKGMGEKAIEQILANRPFNNIEEFLFNENIVYSKLNKRAFDVLIRAGAMADLIDDRFAGDKHFWASICAERPRSNKKLLENIELYRSEGSFSEEEKVDFITDLTGIFPFSLVCNEQYLNTARRKIEEEMNKDPNLEPHHFIPISRYKSNKHVWCFCIVRSCIKRKTKNGRPYYVVEVIDRHSVVKKVRCWGINPEIDSLEVNKPYMLGPFAGEENKIVKYNSDWGFSTRGPVRNNWRLLK
tara:strand:- start:1828 stop:5580 length:3753 start_codon:yes stop_codon:yes gene_type:complete